MVHNGIEYADIQLIAEAYDLLTHVAGLDAPAISKIFEEWNTGDLESFLIEITAEVLGHGGPDTLSGELANLGRKLSRVDLELTRLRELLATLRDRASDLRAA